ncbi:uncharacterized protein UTRI_05310 [Ustilago trichophora]|uniref:BTB domain-containing protein n=1 Tax=Ustilago trichophora TaxID=86804 RepID=A0A5C3EJA6_9BASI|nr:uncharacterized protein UTRI_05310 [Ustilago trichophora]
MSEYENDNTLTDREGFEIVTMRLEDTEGCEVVLPSGWRMQVRPVADNNIDIVLVKTRRKAAVNFTLEAILRVKKRKHSPEFDGDLVSMRLDTSFDQAMFKIKAPSQPSFEFLYRMRLGIPTRVPASPSQSSFLVPACLVEAISAATNFGAWGDVVFLVKSQGGDRAYACLHASIETLQARGANQLCETILQTGHLKLETGLTALYRRNATPHALSLTQAQADRTASYPRSRRYYPVRSVAVTTLRAVLVFLQTGHIEFAQLGTSMTDWQTESDDGGEETERVGEIAHAKAQDETMDEDDNVIDGEQPQQPVQWSRTSMTSPKSVYRLARRFGLAELMKLASDAIEAQITPSNILVELFDLFTLRYPEIRKKRMAYAVAHWNEIKARDKSGLMSILRNCPDATGAEEVFNAIIAQTTISNSPQ